MGIIYRTNEYKGYGKQNYYNYEYSKIGNTIKKEKCHRFKHFDGKESSWNEDRKLVDSWKVDDPKLPEWLHKFI